MRHFTEDATYAEIDEDRAERGPRERGKGFHYALCNGFCPCYKEGVGVAATRHLDVLDWFCNRDADLVRERLALAEASTGADQ